MVSSKINCCFKSWRPKQHLNQNWYKLPKEDGISLVLLYCVDATSTSWACCCVNTLWLVNVVSIASTTNTSLVMLQTLKQITRYNKYYIWNLKSKIQIKLSMALLKIYWPWIISKSWYCIRRPIFLCQTVLFDADFQSHSI
jgi:hypothetical protein